MKHFFVYTLLLVLFSCQNSPHLKGRVDKNLHISFMRFEKELDVINKENIENEKFFLAQKYGEFFTIYNHGVLRLGNFQSQSYDRNIIRFLSDTIYREVYDSVALHYPELLVEEQKLTDAFRNYKLIFPERQIPQCYTHISGFNTPIVVGDSVLSVSLESYLGADHIFYKRLGTYTYLLPRKDRKNISIDAMRGWLVSEFPNNMDKEHLLDLIIQEGKILYLLEVLMPKEKPNLIIGITPEQYTWCQKNEEALWRFMIEKQHLFSISQTTIAKYVQNGPFFNFFGKGSSPLVGKYVGWQIVNSYMASNKDVSIDDLINNTNGQEILEASKYKP